jgi:hypothetical protein
MGSLLHCCSPLALRTGALVTIVPTVFLFMSRKEITKTWQEYKVASES